jgi:hypothetical protein
MRRLPIASLGLWSAAPARYLLRWRPAAHGAFQGDLRSFYEQQISQLRLQRSSIHTVWLQVRLVGSL